MVFQSSAKRFKTYALLNKSSDLKDHLISIYISAAQFDAPPQYQVTQVCKGIDGASSGTDILDRIFAGMIAIRGNRSCYHMSQDYDPRLSDWGWQVCQQHHLLKRL
ncbi:unnamed protein product [Ilex paraguariensis]|uniref:Uncharacterized protein n=1 Tax=Ilex paraguariensis TaxID=185542 RepID=A0ABC8S0P0_9AQUA